VAPRPEPLAQPALLARVRFRFEKLGDARFLSHRNVMDLLERALRAASVPVRYTEGYNPHIRLSMGPALQLGHEALAEMFDVECHGEVTAEMLGRANLVLPEGLQLTSAAALPAGTPSLGKAIASCRYRLRGTNGSAPWAAEGFAAGVLPEGVLDWRVDGGELVVAVNARQVDGPTPSMRAVLDALGVSDEAQHAVRVVREACVLSPPAQSVVRGPGSGVRVEEAKGEEE
jgi:hypothetical protein